MTDDAPRIPAIYRLLANLPLGSRRRLLRAALIGRGLLDRIGGRPQGLGLAEMFQTVLRLPRREALRLDREALRHDLASELEWCALYGRSLPAILRDVARVRIEEPDMFERIAATGRPVILAPLHMGSYVLGLAATMVRYFPGRPMLILRQRDDMAMETHVIQRLREIDIDVRFLNVSERADFLSAVRFAQKGAVIVVFCDLPPDYGAPAAMPMFGQPLSFAFGTDTLARLTGATVVPWATRMETGGDLVRIGRPFEVRGSSPEERADAAAIMRRHIQSSITAAPEQWHLWPTLVNYLPSDAKVTETTPTNEERPHDLAA